MKIAATLFPLLALGLAPAPGLATAPPAIRQAITPDTQALIDANTQLQARVRAATGDTLPLLSNDGGALVRTAFDADTIRKAPLDGVLIGTICQAIGNTIIAYAENYGAAVKADPGVEQSALVRIQNEFSLGTAAGTICAQRAFHAIEKAVDDIGTVVPERMLPSLQMMRAGASMMLQGTLALLELEGVTPENQEMMLAALNEDSAVIAASLPKAERAAMARMVREAMGRIRPGLRPGLEVLATGFDATACNSLCEAAGG